MGKRIFIISAIIISLILVIIFSLNRHKGAVFSNGALQSYLADLDAACQKNDFCAQKILYQKLVNEFSSHRDIGKWQKKLEEANINIIVLGIVTKKSGGEEPVPASIEYEVKPLDTLTKISKKFNTTVELLKKANNLTSDRITPGIKLRIWPGRFSIFVDKSQNILILKSNDELVKTYNVATGTNNSTPAGAFKIVNKLVNPVWYKAGAVVAAGSPENILGTRWLGFDLSGYGIHGTTEPQSIGMQATAGCVRMLNSEVEELYMLVPQGTEVTIVD